MRQTWAQLARDREEQQQQTSAKLKCFAGVLPPYTIELYSIEGAGGPGQDMPALREARWDDAWTLRLKAKRTAT